MDAICLFTRVKKLWPDVVDISREGSNDNNTPFWSLVEIYEQIENELAPDDVWMEVSTWAFHQSLVELAEGAAARNVQKLSVSEVPLALFDRFLRDNLCDPSWEQEQLAYVRQNGVAPIDSLSS